MPTLRSKTPSLNRLRDHFSRCLGAYIFGGIVTVVGGGVITGVCAIENSISEKQAQDAAQAQQRRDQLLDAFRSGKTRITYESGNTYGILSNADVNGDTIVSAHKASGFSTSGDITGLDSEPRVIVRIPAAPQPPAPRAPQ